MISVKRKSNFGGQLKLLKFDTDIDPLSGELIAFPPVELKP